MTVRVVAFARARELLAERHSIEIADGARVSEAWIRLLEAIPQLSEVRGVRFAVGGRMSEPDRVLHEGDELAILPAVGGG
ncbi:MAG TPA: MoaD/ThiS family protein [Candidatus Acidoferrum sp.]|nr:MoaD/ThiS family protein [Candidatus Acidoferrum sp.]